MKTNIFVAISALSLMAVSCGGEVQKPQKAVPEYAAMTIDTTSALITTDFAAELSSAQVVEIRPRVSGYLEKISVEEGSIVKKGQLIFQIDDAELRAQRSAALASVEAARASMASAELEVEKLTPLVEKGIISNFELKTAQSSLEAAEAQLVVAKSQAKNAKIALSYAAIKSPVTGVVGRIVVRPGTLVSPSSQDALTTVASNGPMSAYFSLNENLVLDIVDKTKGAKTEKITDLIPEVSLVMSNGEIYPKMGKVELASGLIDITTGSAQLKAIFPNSEGVLRSGASAKVRINSPHSGVVVIPQSATYELQDKVMVYKVGKDGKIESQNIEIFGKEGVNYVVKSGLERGEVIALEGLDYIKEGDVIKTK